MSVIGRLVVSIVGNNTELKKSLQDTDKLLTKQNKNINYIADQMGKAGKAMTIGLTLPIMGIGVAFGKLAMDAVESENLFEVSMGNMAEDARKWSEELSNSLGLNQYEIRKTVGTFNVMFDSMGIGKQAAYDMATGLTQLAYDMASFYNLDVEEAFQKLQAGITGEIEPLKRLGIVVNETAIQQTALKEGIIKSGETMTEQEKVLARYKTIMEQTSKAQGDLARTMESPANQLRILKDQVKETAISFGELLLPSISKVLDVANNMITKFKNLDDPTKKLVTNIALITAVTGPAIWAISGFTKAIIALKDAYILLKTAGFFGTAGAIGATAGAVAGTIFLTGDSAKYASDNTDKLNQTIYELEKGIKNYERAAKDLAAVNAEIEPKELYEQNLELLSSIRNLGAAYPELIDKAMDLEDSYKNGKIELEQYNHALGKLVDEARMKNWAGQITAVKTAMHQGRIATNNLEEAEKMLVKRTEEATKSTEDLIEAIHKYYNLNQSVTEATWDYEDAIKNLNEVNKDSGATEREKQEAIFGVQDALENLEIAMAKEYEDTETSIERKKELAELYITAGLNAVEAGAISESAFMKMAETYGFTAGEIIKKADELDIKLDWVTRERFIHISHNMNGVESDVDRLYSKLKQMDGMNVTFKMVQTGLMGWASGGIIGYSDGGVVNPILSASAGMITPSYDNGGILSLLHKNEVVLNSGQQRNLAEFIFGLANRKNDVSAQPGITQNITINSPKPLTESELTRQIDLLNRELGIRLGIS